MSHYNVNVSVPKTLIQYLIRWVIGTAPVRRRDRRDLAVHPGHRNLARTRPARRRRQGRRPRRVPRRRSARTSCRISICTTPRATVSAPAKSLFSATHAWGDKTPGDWPGRDPRRKAQRIRPGDDQEMAAAVPVPLLPDQPVQTLRVPNGPKVGSGGSLSPRGDWRAPCDSEAAPWLEELDENVPDILTAPPPQEAPPPQ